MNAMASAAQLERWAIRGADCTASTAVESLEHSRYLLSRHAGHGGCTPYLAALGYDSAVMP